MKKLASVALAVVSAATLAGLTASAAVQPSVRELRDLGDAILGLMLGGSVLGVGLARDRGKKNSARQIVGFICMSVIMVDAAASAADCKSQLVPLILVGAELITMFIGLATDRKWWESRASVSSHLT